MKEFTKYYVRLFMFLMPILFLPITIDAFGMGKNILIMMMAGLGLVIWVLEILINKKEGAEGFLPIGSFSRLRRCCTRTNRAML